MSLDSFMCQGVGNTVLFFVFLKKLCEQFELCSCEPGQKNGISGSDKLGRNFHVLRKAVFCSEVRGGVC